jgi:hypothetical protein
MVCKNCFDFDPAPLQIKTGGINMFGNLLKAVVGVVIETPIAIVSDIATMGGVLTDKREPYTSSALKKVVRNVQDSTD